MRYVVIAGMVCALLGAAVGSHAVQVLTNGDFEGGATSGVPSGWTRVPSTTYSCRGYTADWQLFSTSLNNYPTLDVYAGNYSLGAYRVDGYRCQLTRPGLEFYEWNVLYQTITVSPNTTYRVKASAAAFVHHHRMHDIEDFWGAGIELRICPGAGVYDGQSRVWSHAFWNWEGDSFWRYYPELKNQISHNAANTFTTSSSQTSITFSIIWYAKWDAEMDLCAIDDVKLELTTSGPIPPGSEEFVVKDPASWSGADPVWSPAEKLVHWSRTEATGGGNQFYQSKELTTGMRPVNSTAADLNGDGLPDVAAACQWSHLVSVHLQHEGGGFGPAAYLSGAVMPRCVQAGQVMGTPAVDLVVSSAGTSEVLVYPGVGDGTFGAPIRVATPYQPTWVALGDFNGDSFTDIAAGCQSGLDTGLVSIFLGDGQGGFALGQTITDIGSPSYMLAVDLGGRYFGEVPDGILDLAVLTWSGAAHTYAGLGDGTFQYADTISSQWEWKSTAMAAGNFDEDPLGIPDLCILYMWEADWAQLASGLGGCMFMGQEKDDWLKPKRFPSGIDTLDFNLDGHPDLAISNYVSSNIVIYKNNGSSAGYFDYGYAGHFGAGMTNTHLLTKDIDGDGYTDMVVTSGATQTVNVIYGGPNAAIKAPNSDHLTGVDAVAIGNFIKHATGLEVAVGSDRIRVFRNDGDMRFTEAYTCPINARCVAIGSGDFNSDGNLDIAALGVPSTGRPYFWTLLGDGAGGFSSASYVMMTGTASEGYDLAVADVDGVNGLDLLASEGQAYYEGIYCRVNNGAGVFTASAKKTALPLNSKPRGMAVADFNGDGKKDVVVALAGQNKLGLMTGIGDGFFNAPVTFTTGAEPTGVCAADFTGDGKPDVIVSNKGSDTISVFAGSGTGSFALLGTIAVGPQPTNMETADFDGDGILDLVVGNSGDRTFCHLKGNGDGTFQAPHFYRTADVPKRFAAGDLRGVGQLDLFAAVGHWEVFRNAMSRTGDIIVTDDGASQTSTDQITGYWTASSGGMQDIVRYRWAVSTTPDVSGIIPGGGWVYTTGSSGTRQVSLSLGETYYILAQAEDSANLWTAVGASDGISIGAPEQVGSPAEAKLLADGRVIALSGAVVSRVWDGYPWVCYVQDAGRTSGIRVEGTGLAPEPGSEITITGAMATAGVERMVLASGFEAGGTPGEPGPLGMVARSLGGGGFGYDPGPPASGQAGVTGGSGTSNIGLLVRTAGRVTRSQQGEDCFYISDGSAVDEPGAAGVRCIAEGLNKPTEGSYVAVTGICGAIDLGGHAIRCIRISRQADITPAQ